MLIFVSVCVGNYWGSISWRQWPKSPSRKSLRGGNVWRSRESRISPYRCCLNTQLVRAYNPTTNASLENNSLYYFYNLYAHQVLKKKKKKSTNSLLASDQYTLFDIQFFPFFFFFLFFFNPVDHSCAFLQAMWQTMRLHHWRHSQKWRRPDRKWSAWTPAAQPSARMMARLTYPPPPQSTHTKQVRHINQKLPKYFTTTKISNLRKIEYKKQTYFCWFSCLITLKQIKCFILSCVV